MITAAFLATMLALAACGGTKTSGGGAPAAQTAVTVQMDSGNFVSSTPITLKVGGTVTFQDLAGSSGATHYLVTGNNAAYTAEPGAPADLNNSNGVQFNAGDAKTYTFATAGTYNIACLIHPAMNLQITVQP